MARGLRFGKHIEESRIVIADVIPKQLSFVLFVDDEQKDFDYLYEAFMPLFPTVFDTNAELTERVAKMDGYKHRIERIELKETFDEKSMLSKNKVPYTKEMLVALFGESEQHCKR